MPLAHAGRGFQAPHNWGAPQEFQRFFGELAFFGLFLPVFLTGIRLLRAVYRSPTFWGDSPTKKYNLGSNKPTPNKA